MAKINVDKGLKLCYTLYIKEVMNVRGYKYRIYPSEEQEFIINNTISNCRYIWNGFLALKEFRYKTFGDKVNYNDMSKLLTEIKKTDDFLKEVDSTSLQQTLKQLDNTFKMFFKGHCKYPRFKSKKNPKDSYKSTGVKIKDSKIYIPKVGLIKYSNSRDIKGRILSAVVSRSPTNKYYVSFTVDEPTEYLPKIDKEVGIDLGLKTFAVCSDGFEIKAPKPLWKYTSRLKKLQRRLSKMPKKYANNYEKLRLKIARLHERIANIRNDFLHKLTTKLIRENQSIYLEDLNVKGMTKNKKLAKAILDCGFGYFVQILKTKGVMYGRQIVQIDRWFPSSKTCSCCGMYKVDLKLSDRVYECECGMVMDRDLNASINILLEGRKSIRG